MVQKRVPDPAEGSEALRSRSGSESGDHSPRWPHALSCLLRGGWTRRPPTAAGTLGSVAAKLLHFSWVPSRGAPVSAGETSWVAPFPFTSEPPGFVPGQQGPFCPRCSFSHCIFHTHFGHVMMLYFLLTCTVSRPADKFCIEVCKPLRLESPPRGKSTGFE